MEEKLLQLLRVFLSKEVSLRLIQGLRKQKLDKEKCSGMKKYSHDVSIFELY
ncbi:unnamed protein product [Dovyalis caffra]|uniref:Uncharacterized protein n=1 Tax=Dovyalis caffra TaxID=77055 RepID=A0AAV1RYG8_9ROSI|nr:unnamed protein product [Dovyalis caffra]